MKPSTSAVGAPLASLNPELAAQTTAAASAPCPAQSAIQATMHPAVIPQEAALVTTNEGRLIGAQALGQCLQELPVGPAGDFKRYSMTRDDHEGRQSDAVQSALYRIAERAS